MCAMYCYMLTLYGHINSTATDRYTAIRWLVVGTAPLPPPLSILNLITVTLSITTFQAINSNRSRTLLLVLLLRLLNPHISLPFSSLSTGLRSTNALNVNFFLLPTKFLQPVNLAILTIWSLFNHLQYPLLISCHPFSPTNHPLIDKKPSWCWDSQPSAGIFGNFFLISGLFVPLHFRSREQKVHRENFRSRGTFVPLNICSHGTFVPLERRFQELSFRGTFAAVKLSFLGSERSKNFRSYETLIMRTNIPRTFPPNVLKHDLLKGHSGAELHM